MSTTDPSKFTQGIWPFIKDLIAFVLFVLILSRIDSWVKTRTAPAPNITAGPYQNVQSKFDSLSGVVAQMKMDRTALQQDTARLYNSYYALLSLIGKNKSDSAQLAILRQLLNKPDPTPVDINTQLADGILCHELLDNSRKVIRKDDSIMVKLELENHYRSVQLALCSDSLTEVSQQSALRYQQLEKTKRKLRNWRIVGASQFVAAATGIFLYKLSR
jgi:hypothetical protein